ncbi:MAG: hypothetical protein LBH41_01490 [Rickettsiales bacterium]|jgi:hypothetical protein|nr:hypothetical protein [Rickettsiales bacterium]
MKRILSIFATTCWLAAWPSIVSAGAEFMRAFEEIPLMDGLAEDEAVSFDTEEDRVIDQFVSGDIERADFMKFYLPTLASLGWTQKSSGALFAQFEREDEVLSLTIVEEKPLVARFYLTPKKQKK